MGVVVKKDRFVEVDLTLGKFDEENNMSQKTMYSKHIAGQCSASNPVLICSGFKQKPNRLEITIQE